VLQPTSAVPPRLPLRDGTIVRSSSSPRGRVGRRQRGWRAGVVGWCCGEWWRRRAVTAAEAVGTRDTRVVSAELVAGVEGHRVGEQALSSASPNDTARHGKRMQRTQNQTSQTWEKHPPTTKPTHKSVQSVRACGSQPGCDHVRVRCSWWTGPVGYGSPATHACACKVCPRRQSEIASTSGGKYYAGRPTRCAPAPATATPRSC
jgi:hypothetical protein